MLAETDRLLRDMAEAFNRGDLRGFVAPHTFPCLIAVPGHRTIMRSADDFVTFLEPLRGELILRGVKRVVPFLGAVELLRSGRFRAWVRWTYAFEDRAEAKGYDSVYYLRIRADGSLAIDMVDCEEPAEREVERPASPASVSS